MLRAGSGTWPDPARSGALDSQQRGIPGLKVPTYGVLTQNPIEFHGFKLWYSGEDDPLMSEEDVVNLDPSPDVIIYQ